MGFAVAVSVRCRRSLWVFTVDVRRLVFAVGLSLGFFAVGFSLWLSALWVFIRVFIGFVAVGASVCVFAVADR